METACNVGQYESNPSGSITLAARHASSQGPWGI